MKKPELLISVKDVNELKAVTEVGADAVIIGHQDFGLRVPGDFTLSNIESSMAYAKEKDVKVYINLSAILDNQSVDQLEAYLKQLYSLGADTIVFGDPAVLLTLRELNLPLKLHWHAETTATNWETIQFWERKGIHRAVLARELTLAEVEGIRAHTRAEIEIQIHGMTCIFHSKRKLVSNYFEHIHGTQPKDNMFLQQLKADPTHYPIFEDKNGTHIMSDEDICMLEHLPTLIEMNITSLKIEGLLKSTEYNTQIVRIYREALDTYDGNLDQYKTKLLGWLKCIEAIQPQNRKLGTGFYFKEQVY